MQMIYGTQENILHCVFGSKKSTFSCLAKEKRAPDFFSVPFSKSLH
jgi:hypothetical protein